MTQVSRSTIAASNIGVAAMANLTMWAREVAASLPGCRVYLVGSSVRSKDWRDIDVDLVWSVDDYNTKVVPLIGVGNPRGWWLLCAALSAHGSAVTGLPIEVHIVTEEGFAKMTPDDMRVELR